MSSFHALRLPHSVCEQAVLVVDDSLFQRELTSALLKQMGCERVSEAEDGEQALQRLRGCADDLPLLLVDLEMPRMNGLQLLQSLADEEIRPRVVIISGSDSKRISLVESMVRMRRMPILGTLPKPINASLLHELLLRSRLPY